MIRFELDQSVFEPDYFDDWTRIKIIKKQCTKPTVHKAGHLNFNIGFNFIEFLPYEVSSQILSCLNIQELCRASEVCWQWFTHISDDEHLWKNLCYKTCDHNDVQQYRAKGLSWKESLMKSFRKSQVRKQWQDGCYSNPKQFEDLPGERLCSLDADDWGEILDMELAR